MLSDAASRRLTVTSSSVAFIISLTILIVDQTFLPASSSQVARQISFYAAFSALVSGAGIFGTRRRNASLITIFANFLLLDAIVFTVPRLLLVVYTIALPNTICGHSSGPVTIEQVDFRSSPAYKTYQPRRIDKLEGWASRVTNLNHGQCLALSGVVEGFFVLLVIGLTVAEWWCALKVRRYALSLSQETEQLSEKRSDEAGDHRRSGSSFSMSPVSPV